MFKYIKLVAVVCCSLLLACKLSNNQPLQIDFSKDSTAIVCSNINPSGLLYLKKNLKTDTMYQKLLSVLQTPGENDSTDMEMEWPGKLSMQGDQLVFTPDTPFRKGKIYLVETMINAQFASKKDVLRSEVGHQVKPQQQVLKR